MTHGNMGERKKTIYFFDMIIYIGKPSILELLRLEGHWKEINIQ